MKYVYFLIRLLVGGFFIFSGFVKAVDPIGTAIKMEEYFEVFIEYTPFLEPFWQLMAHLALPISIGMIILELVLGVALILGTLPKLTLWLYAAIIGFFTILTGFSAYTNKVTDCGCFGDFLKLKPIETFTKDVVLSVIIIFLIIFSKHLKTFLPKSLSYILLTISLIAATLFTLRNYYDLPMWDFRAYKEGVNLIKGKSLEGLDPGDIVQHYTLNNTVTKETKTITDKEYMSSGIWKDANWQIDKEKTTKQVIREPEMPKIKDFMIYDETQSNDLADSLLAIKGFMFWVPFWKLESVDKEGFNKVNEFLKGAKADNIPITGLTNADLQKAQPFAQGMYKFYNLDATPIKTMMRANPGIMLTKDAVVVKKWHGNHLPTYSEIKKLYNIPSNPAPTTPDTTLINTIKP